MIDFFSGISRAVQEGDDKEVVKLIKEALVQGLTATDILEKGRVLSV